MIKNTARESKPSPKINRFTIDDMVDEGLERRSEVISILSNLSGLLKLNDKSLRDTIRICQYALQNKILFRQDLLNFLAVAAFAAMRIQSSPIGLAEFSTKVNLPKLEIIRILKDIQFNVLPHLHTSYICVPPEEYFESFASGLKARPETAGKASEIYQKALESGLKITGKDPRAIAGAALYLAMQMTSEYTSQIRIAEVALTSKFTLRARIREIRAFTEQRI